jgi:hypothetical protein
VSSRPDRWASTPMEFLGRLENVRLREVWSSESTDFTPWLAQSENLKLLGETIGILLECEAQEKEVGPFRADIFVRIRRLTIGFLSRINLNEPIIRTSDNFSPMPPA